MSIDVSILRYDEKAVLSLRSLYVKYGYSQFKMNKFEEYDLYMRNKDFLVSDGIITFTDTNGKLLALKPDVTLSIIKNCNESDSEIKKVYYDENVYRISGGEKSYKEIMQTGLECIGNIGIAEKSEVLSLALMSLATLSSKYILDICHIGFLNSLLDYCKVDGQHKDKIIKAVAEKNPDLIKALLPREQCEKLNLLFDSYGNFEDFALAVKSVDEDLCGTDEFCEFSSMCEKLSGEFLCDRIRIDFSSSESKGYYSGVIFKGYIDGISEAVLSGGQYDGLMKKIGRSSGAIGFAVYLNTLERLENGKDCDEKVFINVALPKGRLGEKVYDMFEKAGFECPSIKENNRKLTFENEKLGIRFFWVKPSDVAIYVERGAADIGVAGKDILLEYSPDVYELIDLDIGKCRMAVAAKNDFCDNPTTTLRVATKFSNIARKYYAEKGRDIDIIHLNGSIELAPILGLSDVIVDIVETGKTLLENNLRPYETIVDISARLVANKASYQFKKQKIEKIKEGLSNLVLENPKVIK